MTETGLNAFQALFGQAGTDAFQEALAAADASVQPATVTSDVYHACFSTAAGRAVLTDLYSRFVNGPRWAPGESPDTGVYREGAAWVVFDIASRVEAAARGEADDDGQENG